MPLFQIPAKALTRASAPNSPCLMSSRSIKATTITGATIQRAQFGQSTATTITYIATTPSSITGTTFQSRILSRVTFFKASFINSLANAFGRMRIKLHELNVRHFGDSFSAVITAKRLTKHKATFPEKRGFHWYPHGDTECYIFKPPTPKLYVYNRDQSGGKVAAFPAPQSIDYPLCPLLQEGEVHHIDGERFRYYCKGQVKVDPANNDTH